MVTKPLNSRVVEEYPESASAAPAPPPKIIIPVPEPAIRRTHPLWHVTFHLTGAHPNAIGLAVWRVTVLGRADPTDHAFKPDLDYGPYGGIRYGVSRRHALLRPEEDSLNIFDQSSTNGTWVNGQRLMPGQGLPLSDGDIIELGALRMTLRVDESPMGQHTSRASSKGRMRGFGFRFLGQSPPE